MGRYNKENYEWYKSMGICPDCGSERAAPGRTRCEECLAKRAEYAQRRRDSVPKEQYKAEYQKANKIRYWARKQTGRCTTCGKPLNPKTDGKRECRNCLNVRNNCHHAKVVERQGGMDIDRTERKNYGMCYFCCAPVEDGKKICPTCMKRFMSVRQNNATECYKHMKRDNNIAFRN